MHTYCTLVTYTNRACSLHLKKWTAAPGNPLLAKAVSSPVSVGKPDSGGATNRVQREISVLWLPNGFFTFLLDRTFGKMILPHLKVVPQQGSASQIVAKVYFKESMYFRIQTRKYTKLFLESTILCACANSVYLASPWGGGGWAGLEMRLTLPLPICSECQVSF